MPAPENELDEFETGLNAALRAYADPADGPRPALLAARVITASAEHAARSRRWLYGGFAAAVTCALVVAIALISTSRLTPRPREARLPVASMAAPGHPLQGHAVQLALPPPPGRHHRAVPLQAYRTPKLDRFPQPRPLSEQEKLMLAFVSSASADDQRVAARAAQIPPFQQIAELDLQPISTSIPKIENSGASHEKPR